MSKKRENKRFCVYPSNKYISVKDLKPPRTITEEEKALRGKEICFLFYYLWVWMDEFEIDKMHIRRTAIALATLSGCDAKPLEEMMELKFISVDPTEDVQWKTEHNIYPHFTTKHEIVYCIKDCGMPSSFYAFRRIAGMLNGAYLGKLKNWIENKPSYYSVEYDYGTILHKEHWETIQIVMWWYSNLVRHMPMLGTEVEYDGKMLQLIKERNLKGGKENNRNKINNRTET